MAPRPTRDRKLARPVAARKTKKMTDAATRDRTRDLQIFSLTLSQLSYSGVNPGHGTVDCTAPRNFCPREKIKKYPWRDLNPQSSDS